MKQNYLKKTNELLNFFTFLLLSIVFTSNAQCPTGSFVLSTQAEVNAFAVNYPNCTQIAGNLQIGPPNTALPGNITDLTPLSNITQVNGTLYIQNNGVLQNVNGLNITNVGGGLYIGGDYNDKTNLILQDISALSSIISVGGWLTIQKNLSLTNLNGLQNLATVAHDIYINDNDALTDISGLQNTSFNAYDGYGLTITGNAVLAVCNLPNFCTYLSNPVNTYPRNISGNLTNCLNEAAVISSCNLSVTVVSDYKISYYPNPVKDIFNLSYSEDIVSISVMNTLGQLVLSQNIGSNNAQIDMSTLPSGNYFVKVESSEVMRTVKVIKL